MLFTIPLESFSSLSSIVNPSDNNASSVLYADKTHNLSIRYSTEIKSTTPTVIWHSMLWVDAPPQVLQQIKSVSYQFYPVYRNNVETTDTHFTTDYEKKFSTSEDIFGGIHVNVKIYFKDGSYASYPKLLVHIFCDIRTTECPNALFINPKIYGLNVIINGNISRLEGSLQNIFVDWGDGTNSSSLNFPILHTYNKAALYTISIKAEIKTRPGLITSSRNITTDDLNLENSIPLQSPVKISAKANAILNVSANTISIRDNMPFSYKLDGNLVDMSGVGYNNKSIFIEIFWKEHPDQVSITDRVKTDNDGHFSYTYDNLLLHEGNYQVLVEPIGSQFAGFNVTQNLFVVGHVLSKEELTSILTTYIGTGIGITGALVTVPGLVKKRKQSKYLSAHLIELNNKFIEFCKTRSMSKEEYLDYFTSTSSHIIYLLKNGKINEDQYKTLDSKINDYIDRISNSDRWKL